MRIRPFLRCAASAVVLSLPAAAVTITPSYATGFAVYQDAGGNIYTAAAVGRTDVTATFKYDVDVAITVLQNSIMVPWSETITFQLASLGAGTVGDSLVNTTDGDGRPATSTIRFNTDAGFMYYIDSTPWDNGEFNVTSTTAPLGGGNVNNRRLGNATADGGAAGRWDLLTLAYHEIAHSVGISTSLPRFINLAGPNNSAGRKLTIPIALSGLTNPFDIPITFTSAHYDGSDPVFNLSSVSDPGWTSGQRALPTALDILGICYVEGCTAPQVNTELVGPEPISTSLLAGGLALIFWRRRSVKSVQ